MINSDNFNNGNYFEQLIFKLPYDYSSQFLITVHQNSITRGAYNYWQLVQQESRRSGSIFDPAPVNIKGNIESTDKTQKSALGYFMASASESRRLLIDRSIAKGTPDKARLIGDCRYLYHRAYEEKPEGFK